MICYPLSSNYVGMMKGKEKYLLHIINKNSFQCEKVFMNIDYYDFYYRCFNFYNEDDYDMEGRILIYTHPITKKRSEIRFEKNYFSISSLQGFHLFLVRYFKECFVLHEDGSFSWISSEILDEM